MARCPVPIFLRESRDFAFDPAELEAKITRADQAADPQHAAQSDRGHAAAGGSRRDRRDPGAPSASLGVRRRDLFAARLCRRLRNPRHSPGHARPHDHLRRRVEDVGDDRLAHRLCRQPHHGAGVHALDHEHGFVRVADLAVGGARGGARTAGRRRRDARELSRAPGSHRRLAERGSRHHVQDAGRRVLCVAERHRGLPHHRLRRLGSVSQAAA